MENKITSGIWFVFIGMVLLLHNINVIDFNFVPTLKYWPLLIVIVGINLMVQNKVYGNYIKIASNVLFLGWIFYIGITSPSTHWTESLLNNKNIQIGDLEDGQPFENNVQASIDSGIHEARLEFNGGAGKFELTATNKEQLLTAKSQDNAMGMNLQSTINEGVQELTLNAKPVSDNKKSGAVLIDLNPDILWDFELNYGAANITGDLSSLSFKNLEINTGASNLDLTLGAPKSETAKIAIATGASKIHFHIPEDAAISVKYSSILSKNSFEGFETKKNGIAKTANYDSADKKYDIEIDGAANTFKITRY
ncbi:LiaI-LiaF-like domain-containing protein [Sphingobacterium sp. LRF_L2]|uniref:LiaI-LiaF-like domain-containing protein n=1 Tax=Sphingobacterium sp. LRF_L2 TaxID=3369421 RepID=UPI003F631811